MRKNIRSVLILASVSFLLLLIPISNGIVVVNDAYEFVGLRGYTVHCVSSSPIQHTINLDNNDTVSVYVVNRALNISDFGAVPADYVEVFTGRGMTETFVLSATVVTIVVEAINPVRGTISWDHGLGFPDEGMTMLTWIIVMLSVGIGLFVVYRIYRWRKLKE
jgi:hypothetical protein